MMVRRFSQPGVAAGSSGILPVRRGDRGLGGRNDPPFPRGDQLVARPRRSARLARSPHALQSSTPLILRHMGVLSEEHLEQTLVPVSGGGSEAPPEEVDVEVEADGEELRCREL